MPIEGTRVGETPSCPEGPRPLAAPAATPISCEGMHVLVPATPKDAISNRPVLARTRVYVVTGRRPATLRHTMQTPDGRPVALTDCACDLVPTDSSVSAGSDSSSEGCSRYVQFRLERYLDLDCGSETALIIKTARILDAEAGLVEVDLTAEELSQPGIFFGLFAVVSADEADDTGVSVLFSNHFYVHISADLFSGRRMLNGPPSIAEVRMYLRDSAGAENRLLDNLKFSDEEITLATMLPVQEWNETPPPIQQYTPSNFPFRYHWLVAITAHLFRIAAEQQRANNLSYSAGGVAVDDSNKEPNYDRAAELRFQEWRAWMRQKKVSMNLEGGYGGLGSTYGRWG